jgi:uncharacterized membrane protein
MKNKSSIRSQRLGHVAPSSRRQRGAAALFAAVTIFFAIIVTLLAINVGQMYYSKRELQKLAALGALAGAEVGSGCSNGGVPGSLAQVTAAVQNALISNNLSTSQATSMMSGFNGAPPVELGHLDSTSGKRLFVALTPGDPRIDSVRVNFTSAAASFIGGYLSAAPPTLQASATAQQPALGDFSIDTGLLDLSTDKSPLLGPLLQGLFGTGTAVDVNLLNSSGLAQAKVSLKQLELAAGVNDLNELLRLNLNLTQALNILGQALSGTAGGAVSGLAAQVYNGGGGPVRQYFGDLFNNVGGQLNPLATDVLSAVPFVGGMDLLNALGEDAAKGGTILISTNGGLLSLINIPGLTKVGIYLRVIQPPSFSVLQPAGPANTAHSAQLTLYVRLNINLLALVVMNLGLDLDVPSANGTLTALQCPRNGPNPSASIDANTVVANLSMGAFDPNSGASPPPLGHGNLIQVLGGLLTVTLKSQQAGPVTVGNPASSGTGPYDTYASTSLAPAFPHNTRYDAIPPHNTDTLGSKQLLTSAITSLFNSLTSNNNLQVCVLGICVGPLVDPLLNAIANLLSPLAAALDTLIDELLKILGVQIGVATINMQEVLIGQPVIVTSTLAGVTAGN